LDASITFILILVYIFPGLLLISDYFERQAQGAAPPDGLHGGEKGDCVWNRIAAKPFESVIGGNVFAVSSFLADKTTAEI